MVAFGKKLKGRQIQEWNGYYIDYKLMKRKVEQCCQIEVLGLERRYVLKGFLRMLDNEVEKFDQWQGTSSYHSSLVDIRGVQVKDKCNIRISVIRFGLFPEKRISMAYQKAKTEERNKGETVKGLEAEKEAMGKKCDEAAISGDRGMYAPKFSQLPVDMMTTITMHKAHSRSYIILLLLILQKQMVIDLLLYPLQKMEIEVKKLSYIDKDRKEINHRDAGAITGEISTNAQPQHGIDTEEDSGEDLLYSSSTKSYNQAVMVEDWHKNSDMKGGIWQKKPLDTSNLKKPTGFERLRLSRRKPQSPPSKPVQKFARSGSLRSLRILRTKSISSKSKKSPTPEDLHSKRATCSSILKDSKFHEQVEPQVGIKESKDVFPVEKLCRYQHCSLNGHHHHEPPAKRFAYLKRRSPNNQKGLNPQTQGTDKRASKKQEVKVTKNNQGGDKKAPVPENGKPNGWNYIKKVKLLKSFMTELEKAKKSNPNKRENVPLVSEPESEIVSLRHQAIGDKKSYNEWKLDYALQQVVGELAPSQKRKVSLLVKAFETVAPK
ncbi:putative calmodulin-binding domain containing protein [Tanacetum coccineum]